MHTTYLRYHMGSASLVILSFAFIIFFIYKKINICEWVSTETFGVLTNTAMLYLNIDEIVEWVNVLLHKPFHLRDEKENQFILRNTENIFV